MQRATPSWKSMRRCRASGNISKQSNTSAAAATKQISKHNITTKSQPYNGRRKGAELTPAVEYHQREEYDESKIRHLDDTDHIRTRPGMYIGRLGDGSHAEDGIYVLLKETIDNSVDEFNEGFGKRIEVEVENEKGASIRDYGRGIPLGSLVAAVSQLNTGAKYDTAVFTASVGLNGVGLKAVNALSQKFYSA